VNGRACESKEEKGENGLHGSQEIRASYYCRSSLGRGLPLFVPELA
jgi:hypothetical protein